MVRRISYFARETVISLRRNLLMTLAGILTVAVSLLIAGGAFLIKTTVDNGAKKWRGGVEMEIFMRLDVTQEQLEAVADELASDPRVKRFTFVSEEEAVVVFKDLFADQPELTSTIEVGDLPSSYRVVPKDAADTAAIADSFAVRPGVDAVETAEEQIKGLLRATNIVQTVLLAIAIALVLASVFLIVNTIRLATFARRREIEVMKLVGASNWFVRVPFMAEGLVQGLLGAVLALAGVYTLQRLLSSGLASSRGLLGTFSISTSEAMAIGWVLLVIGTVIGMVGSMVGLRRFLDV